MPSAWVVFVLWSTLGPFVTATPPIQQCTLKDKTLKCGSASCQVTMGSPALAQGKYRIGKKQTETAEGLPSSPFYYVYKAINGEPSKGFWAELTFIPEMRCSKETPWMNSDRLALANSFGMQNQQCYSNTIQTFLDSLSPKRFDVKVCPSANACQSGNCANLGTLGVMRREYLIDLIVE